MSEKTGYKYSISFHQSVSSGVIGFEGHLFFDAPSDNDSNTLVELLKVQEDEFKKAGYKVASTDIPIPIKETKEKK